MDAPDISEERAKPATLTMNAAHTGDIAATGRGGSAPGDSMTTAHRWASIARVLAVAALSVLASNAAAAAQGPGESETCKGCHAAYVETYEASIHGKKGHPRTPANAGECTACHANSLEHASKGGGRGVGGVINPGPRNKAMSAEQKDQICLTCHTGNRHLAFWESGRHKKN